jgi:hypothetical protein
MVAMLSMLSLLAADASLMLQPSLLCAGARCARSRNLPKLNRKRALFVLAKIDVILGWEKGSLALQ